MCDQSPFVVQFQNVSPFHIEPANGAICVDFDTYYQVLGYGKALGVLSIKLDPDNSGQVRLLLLIVYTFYIQ